MTLISPFFKHWIVEVGDVIDVSYTDKPSFFNSLRKAVEECDFEAGEKVYEYCTQSQSRLWEMCVNKSYLNKSYLN